MEINDQVNQIFYYPMPQVAEFYGPNGLYQAGFCPHAQWLLVETILTDQEWKSSYLEHKQVLVFTKLRPERSE